MSVVRGAHAFRAGSRRKEAESSVSGASSQPVPELRLDVDITKIALSVEEAYVVSRIDGRSGVSEIAMLIGKNAGETQRILTRLAKLGVVQFGDIKAEAARPKPAPARGEAASYDGFVFPPHLLMEDNALDEETRKRIIWTHEHLGAWTHYELLQSSHKTDARGIKKAYFARSKEWHPDRFRRGDQGSFRKLIETIYKSVNESYRVLSDETTRAEYDKTCVFEFDEAELERLVEKKKEQERKKRDAERLVERRKKHNPVRRRIAQAREFYDQALEMEAEGRVMEALRLVQMAVTYDEREKEYKDIAARLKDAAGEFRIERYMKRGLRLEATLEWDDAIDMFEEAVRIAPNSGRARLRLAWNLLMGGRDAQVALGHAQRAVALLSDEPEAHFVVGRLYEATNMDKLAKRAYEQALLLRPTYVEVKKRLKRLKWGF